MKQLTQKQLNSLQAAYQKGRRALQLGAFEQAEKCFSDIIEIDSNSMEAQASLAFVYAAIKQPEKATLQLKLLLKNNPNHAQTHYNLANSLYEQRLYDEAIQHYQKATKLEPKFVEAHIHCGIAYRMQKNYNAAIASLHQALDLDKANARAFYVLGMVYVDMGDINRALHCLECAAGLAPNQTDYRASFAKILEKGSLDYEAGLQYHLACESNPKHLDSFISYGAFLHKHHRHDEALECVKWAEELAPQNLDIIDQLGNIYKGMNNTEAALSQFKAALKVEPKRLSSLTGMEHVYLETGKLDDAIAVCDEIIAIDTALPTGYLLKARVKKSKANDGLAECLIKFAEQNDLDEETRIIANFNLGKIFDDQNNYEQAFKYYTKGNALKNKEISYSTEAEEAKFSKLIEVFNTDLFIEHKLGVESNFPVVIVGMPRSGTTLTEQIISSHPNVVGAGEVIFWGKAPFALPLRLGTGTAYPDCIVEMTAEQAKDIASMYETTLQNISGSGTKPKHITDKMPHNFLNLGLIALLFPNIKIIHTKRNPIDTCLSIFFQNFNKAHPYAFNLSNLGFHYKQYQRIMRHWHEVLPGRIMDINYEDTISDPEYWSRKLIDHIGLDWDEACLAPHKLERSVKTASHWQVRQPIYKTSVQRWKNYEEFLGPLIEALKD
jgi:tetratricopeptide (TPR) repeat protein